MWSKTNFYYKDFFVGYLFDRKLFRTIRYEELSMDPFKYTQELFKFFRLDFHPQVVEFLDSHTKLNVGGVSSTFRNSKSAPFHWRTDLNFSEVQYIEQNCDEAMQLWGYLKAKNESHLRDFYPLTSYTINWEYLIRIELFEVPYTVCQISLFYKILFLFSCHNLPCICLKFYLEYFLNNQIIPWNCIYNDLKYEFISFTQSHFL